MNILIQMIMLTFAHKGATALIIQNSRVVGFGLANRNLPSKFLQRNVGMNRNERSSKTASALYSTDTAAVGGVHYTAKEEEVINSMLYRIRECNYMPEEVRSGLLDFVVDGKTLGKTPSDIAKRLCEASPESSPVFEISTLSSGQSVLTLSDESVGTTSEARTDAVMGVMEKLREEGMITGWRDELLPLTERFYDEPLFLVERAAAPFLGMQQYGIHMNGLVRSKDSDDIVMWMARRSATKSKFPGMLDQMVAGGQPAGLGLMENVLKECMEEAGVPESLAKAGIKATGGISYETIEYIPEADGETSNGVVTRCMLYCYDLYLPEEFEPKAVDGEVDYFFKWTLDEVKESMHPDYDDPIKPNCYLCIIDYLQRDGHISPEVPGYLDILRELRSGYCG